MPQTPHLDEVLAAELAQRRIHHLYREPLALTSPQGPEIRLGAQRLVNFGANDYLGLAADGRLSRPRVIIYPHRDVAALRQLFAELPPSRRRLLVTETVFSMDGDTAPLAELAELARRHATWLMVDEAHAVGVLGPGGRGLAQATGVTPDIAVGTLGKAFGCFGAYVAGSTALVDFLRNTARTF